MKTLVRIDSSARTTSSNSREMGDYFVARWREANPGGRLIARDLAETPVPHLTNATIEAFYARERCAEPGAQLSDKLVGELEAADHLLITSPLYNLTLPSTLKSWFDHVVVPDRTFEMGPEGWRGLLRGKSATIITAQGGVPIPGFEVDFQRDYLKAVLSFIGISSVELIELRGTMMDEATKEASMEAARRQVDSRCAALTSPPSN